MPLIDCPVCEGSGFRYDTDIAEWTQEVCIACHGSKTLSTDRATWIKKGRPRKNTWTDKDDDYLRKARGKGVYFAVIATELGRSFSAVRTRRINLIKTGKWY